MTRSGGEAVARDDELAGPEKKIRNRVEVSPVKVKKARMFLGSKKFKIF